MRPVSGYKVVKRKYLPMYSRLDPKKKLGSPLLSWKLFFNVIEWDLQILVYFYGQQCNRQYEYRPF